MSLLYPNIRPTQYKPHTPKTKVQQIREAGYAACLSNYIFSAMYDDLNVGYWRSCLCSVLLLCFIIYVIDISLFVC